MNKELIFKFQDNEYKITFPNNGEYLRIQNLKTALAPNLDVFQYIGAEGSLAATIVEVEAHLSVLCPQLIKDLVKPFNQLELIDSVKLIEAYSAQFRPWYNKNMNVIFGVNKTEEENAKSDQQPDPTTEG